MRPDSFFVLLMLLMLATAPLHAADDDGPAAEVLAAYAAALAEIDAEEQAALREVQSRHDEDRADARADALRDLERQIRRHRDHPSAQAGLYRAILTLDRTHSDAVAWFRSQGTLDAVLADIDQATGPVDMLGNPVGDQSTRDPLASQAQPGVDVGSGPLRLVADCDDAYELRINGHPVLSGGLLTGARHPGDAIQLDLAGARIITVRAEDYGGGREFVLAVTNEAGELVFSTGTDGWVSYTPANPNEWWVVEGATEVAPAVTIHGSWMSSASIQPLVEHTPPGIWGPAHRTGPGNYAYLAFVIDD